MTTESELRQSIANVWGEGSPQVATFDRMLEKYVRQIALNSELNLKVNKQEQLRAREIREIQAEFKGKVLRVINNVYDINKDPYKIYTSRIAAIKKGVINL